MSADKLFPNPQDRSRGIVLWFTPAEMAALEKAAGNVQDNRFDEWARAALLRTATKALANLKRK